MGSSFGSTIAVLLFFSAMFGGFAWLYIQKSNQLEQLEKLRSSAQIESMIVEEIQNCCDLSVYRINFNSTAKLFEEKTKIGFVKIPGTARDLTVHYTGTIVVGCDLKNIRAHVIDDKVHLDVPNCQILDCYPDPKSYEDYDNSGILSKKISLDEQNRAVMKNLNAVMEDLDAVKEAHIRNGLITDANAQVAQKLDIIVQKFNRQPDINLLN